MQIKIRPVLATLAALFMLLGMSSCSFMGVGDSNDSNGGVGSSGQNSTSVTPARPAAYNLLPSSGTLAGVVRHGEDALTAGTPNNGKHFYYSCAPGLRTVNLQFLKTTLVTDKPSGFTSIKMDVGMEHGGYVLKFKGNVQAFATSAVSLIVHTGYHSEGPLVYYNDHVVNLTSDMFASGKMTFHPAKDFRASILFHLAFCVQR